MGVQSLKRMPQIIVDCIRLSIEQTGGILMLFIVLLLLKTLLFMNSTKVMYHRPWVFFISFLIITFTLSLIYLSNLKKKQTWAFTFYNIVSAFMFADIMYFTYFNMLPSIKMVKMLGAAAAAGDSVKSIFTLRNMLFIIDIPFLMFYSKWKKKQIKEKNKVYNKYIRWGVPIAIGLILVFSLSYLSKAQLFGPVTNQELFTYHAKDIKKTLLDDEDIVEGASIFTEEDLEELKARTKLEQGKYTGVGHGKNLIVIQVEALQNFVINRDYNGQEITPNLNKLIEEQGTLYFDKYYQLISRGNTSDAEFVTNNSLYPSADEPTYTQYGNNTFYGLPWILRDNGYTAWAFHGYEKEFWNRNNAYPNQGFQRFISEEDYDVVESIGFGITDEEFFQQSMEYLEELNNIDHNPFYSFIITLTSHNPFKMPEKYQYLTIEEKHKDTLLGNYLQAIHYADKALGDFLEDLKAKDLYDNSVIAIYGDHFGITSANKEPQEIMTEYLGFQYDLDEMMKIPLIIHVPGEGFNETISKVGSQLDFAPTILNIMGYENEKGLMFGRDLVNYKGPSLVAPQTYALKGSIITDDVLIAMSRDGIFENSRGFRLDNRQPINLIDYKDDHKKAIAEINKSNFILKNNLLKEMIEGDGEVDFNQIMTIEIPIDKTIKESKSTIEDLDALVEEGYTTLAIDLTMTNEEIYLGPNIPFEQLAKWLEENENIYLIASTGEENHKEIFTKIMKEYKVTTPRIIPVIDDLGQHYSVDNIKYKNIILNLEENKYTDEEILDFLERYNLLGIIMDKDMTNTELPKKIKEKGTISYVKDSRVNKLTRKLKRKGVYGIWE